MLQRSFIIAGALALSSCTTIENTVAGKPADLTPDLPTVPENWTNGSVPAADSVENWLTQFNDTDLISVVEEALTANPDILASEARVRAAREQSRAVFGRSLPSVNYSFTNGYATQFTSTALGGGVVVDGRF
ncbi:MAG: TolC family protein, partial [Pseudomonadota bacterium]